MSSEKQFLRSPSSTSSSSSDGLKDLRMVGNGVGGASDGLPSSSSSSNGPSSRSSQSGEDGPSKGLLAEGLVSELSRKVHRSGLQGGLENGTLDSENEDDETGDAMETKSRAPSFMSGELSETNVGDLCVRGLAWTTTEESLRRYFSQFGEMTLCSVKLGPDGRSKGYGFVNFKDPNVVDKILQISHVVDKRQIQVRPPRERQHQPWPAQALPVNTTASLSQNSNNPRRVYVGMLNPDIHTPEKLKLYFSRFGSVSQVFLPQPNRGFGFVSFDSEETVKAVHEVLEHTIEGIRVQVKKAVTKPKSGSGTGRPGSPSGSSMGSASNSPLVEFSKSLADARRGGVLPPSFSLSPSPLQKGPPGGADQQTAGGVAIRSLHQQFGTNLSSRISPAPSPSLLSASDSVGRSVSAPDNLGNLPFGQSPLSLIPPSLPLTPSLFSSLSPNSKFSLLQNQLQATQAIQLQAQMAAMQLQQLQVQMAQQAQALRSTMLANQIALSQLNLNNASSALSATSSLNAAASLSGGTDAATAANAHVASGNGHVSRSMYGSGVISGENNSSVQQSGAGAEAGISNNVSGGTGSETAIGMGLGPGLATGLNPNLGLCPNPNLNPVMGLSPNLGMGPANLGLGLMGSSFDGLLNLLQPQQQQQLQQQQQQFSNALAFQNALTTGMGGSPFVSAADLMNMQGMSNAQQLNALSMGANLGANMGGSAALNASGFWTHHSAPLEGSNLGDMLGGIQPVQYSENDASKVASSSLSIMKVPQLFVTNLSYETNQEDLASYMGRYGHVVRTEIMRDENGQSRGKALVRFSNVEQATKACQATHNQMFQGRVLAVKEDSPARNP